MTQLPASHNETPAESQRREAENYEARAAAHVIDLTPHALREQLWLNDRLPPSVLGTRFQVQKLTIGPFYRMRATDLVTGKVQEFAAGQWGFLEAWMEDQTEGRS